MSSNAPTGSSRSRSASSVAKTTKRTAAKVKPKAKKALAAKRANGRAGADASVEGELFVVESTKPRLAETAPATRRRVRAKQGTDSDDGHSTDPVRVYLREMGQVSLLTREGEVEIAKRIEAGLFDAQVAVLGTPMGIARTLEIGDIVRRKDVNLGKVIDGLGMLVNQGVIGIRHWTGVAPDPAVMRAALEEIFG